MWRKTKSTKTMAARPSGPGKAGAVKSAKNMLTDVVAEGFLWQRSMQYKTDRWKRRYFRLTSAGLLTYYKPQIGDRGSTSRMRPKGGIQLSGDYFVADSLLRSHAFQLSDFATTFYLAADNSKDALSWMFKFRAVLLVLGGEGEDRVSLVISTRPAAASGSAASAEATAAALAGRRRRRRRTCRRRRRST